MASKAVLSFIIAYIVRATVTQRTYSVVPSDWPATQCPMTNCYHLTELLNSNVLHLNVSNVTILLYPGIHRVTSKVNTIFSITSAANLVIRTVNSSVRATIKCNGSIGFEFLSCTNITIRDITIENYGALNSIDFHHQRINISVYISHSLGMHIMYTHIINGTGIGLLVENVQDHLLILNSIFSHNDGNVYILTYDNNRVLAIHSGVQILNSSFNDMRNISTVMPQSGIVIHLYQTIFHSEIEVKNVHLVNTMMTNIYAELNLYYGAVNLHNLNLINTKKKQNLHFKITNLANCTMKGQSDFIMNSANFIGGQIEVTGKGYPITVIINNTKISHGILFVKQLEHVIFSNVSIEESDFQGEMQILNCAISFVGYFFYQRNKGTLFFHRSNLTVEALSCILIRKNTQILEAPLHSTDSTIKLLSGSLPWSLKTI